MWGVKFCAIDNPAVAWQDGGPFSAMTQQWEGIVEMPSDLLPNFGVPLRVVALSGRDGFGHEFMDGLSDSSDFGQVDIDEQVDIVDPLVRGDPQPASVFDEDFSDRWGQ